MCKKLLITIVGCLVFVSISVPYNGVGANMDTELKHQTEPSSPQAVSSPPQSEPQPLVHGESVSLKPSEHESQLAQNQIKPNQTEEVQHQQKHDKMKRTNNRRLYDSEIYRPLTDKQKMEMNINYKMCSNQLELIFVKYPKYYGEAFNGNQLLKRKASALSEQLLSMKKQKKELKKKIRRLVRNVLSGQNDSKRMSRKQKKLDNLIQYKKNLSERIAYVRSQVCKLINEDKQKLTTMTEPNNGTINELEQSIVQSTDKQIH